MRLPSKPPSQEALLPAPDRFLEVLSSGIGRLPSDDYLHWDTLRRKPAPEGFTTDEWWAATKVARLATRHELPFRDKAGRPFWFSEHGHLHRQLHRIDRDASGQIAVPADDVANPGTRSRYVMRSLVEEAITSSQLEGAATTRAVAKELLRTGRPPRDDGERMIVNNYRAMAFIRERGDQDLTVEMLLDLQRVLTEGTLDPGAVGRFRRPSDDVHVVDMDNNILHTPPDARELGERMDALLAFANATDDEEFLHPVVRAVMLHFMIGYDHPFVDGNGRAARGLFYWSMARADYWLMEFVSISEFIRKSPARYGRAYLYSENDDNDATYFLHYHVRIIRQCIDALHDYLGRKILERRRLERMLGESGLGGYLNHRQQALLAHMAKHPETTYTIEGHRRSNSVSYHTARKDLDALAQMELLTRATRRGRKLYYRMHPSFPANLGDVTELLG